VVTPEPLHLFDDRARPPFVGPVDSVQLAARRSDPETSVTAAGSITPGRTEAAILDLFRVSWFTDDELAAVLAPEHYGPTVKTARSRLSKAGLLVDTGQRRPSSRGRDMIVWRLA
jgi:hypothetical protein